MISYKELDPDSVRTVVRVEQWLLSSFDFITTKESGNLYVPGSSQGLTRLLHYKTGRLPRKSTGMTRADMRSMSKDELMALAIDLGALAPTNLSTGRIATFSDLPNGSRAGKRFQVLKKVGSQVREGFDNPAMAVQLAAVGLTPKPLLTSEDHKLYWVSWKAMAQALSDQNNWQPLRVCVKMHSGAVKEVLL